jgi:hypothetical protein
MRLDIDNRSDELEWTDPDEIYEPAMLGHPATQRAWDNETAGKMAAQTPQPRQQQIGLPPPAPTDRIVATRYPRFPGSFGSYLPVVPPAPTPTDTPGPSSALAHPNIWTASLTSQLKSLLQHTPPASSPPTPFNGQTATISTGVTTFTTTPNLLLNPTFYHPMNSRTPHRPITQPETHALLLKGFSPNYRGDPNLTRNQSAAIPTDANCSLFLVGLAPNLTTHELLAGIRGVGRVYATHINPPDPGRGHVLSAAKVVFFERGSAGSFCLFFLILPHLHGW